MEFFIDLPENNAWCFAEFLKRIFFDDYIKLFRTEEECLLCNGNG